ncbi:Transmembrane protease serine 9 [Trichinella zimbabwensis]|uniref:Transmembrane protease serine 9 n=1 Tax=Trichinella zimbabwensis TaxID=268475 RepID=A0A0V1HCX2_9BILA|nr:Transmembrane protease serine 9 [Trichinella zimbabwensis]
MNRLINFLLIWLLNFNVNVESEVECGQNLHENMSPVNKWKLNSTISMPKFNPWNVFISGKNKACGGVLIQVFQNNPTSEIVLTSSQCFIDKDGHRLNHANYKVFLGAYNFDENKRTTSRTVGIKHITVMEFDNQTMLNDLALITLETTIQFDYNIRAVCLPHFDFDLKDADWISLTGWKTDTKKNYELGGTGILQQIPIATLSAEECQEIIPTFHRTYHTCDIECGISHYLPATLYTSVGYPPNYTNAIASPYSMPWNVIIQAEHKICGGVLIRIQKTANSSNTVLSSSSCFSKKFGMKPNHANTKVHLGVHKFPSDTDKVTVGIKHVTSTPYEQGMMKKDIALITLQAEVEFNEKIRPICFPHINFKPPVAYKYPLVGWALSEIAKIKGIPYLLQVPVKLIDSSDCATMLKEFSKDDHICGYFADPHIFNNTVPLDHGSVITSLYQKNIFLIGMLSGIIPIQNSSAHILLFSRISTSVEWIMRSSDPSSLVDFQQFLPSSETEVNIPCGRAIVQGPEIQASVGYPPNFKNVMAVPQSMPWNVIVQAEIGTCGGVLIRFNEESNYTDIVLTSSRCFFKSYKADHANVKVHLGVHKLPLSRNTVTIGVKYVTTTPFTKNDTQKDLALITLEGDVEISEKIRPICLPARDLEIPTPTVLWLVGWNTMDGYGLPSKKIPFLMQLPVLIITPSNCKKLFTNYSNNDHICGRYVDQFLFNITKNVDYGSPLIGKNQDNMYVLGTFNGHIMNPNGTGSLLIFSRVSTAMEWIVRSSNPSSYIEENEFVVVTNHKCGVEKFPQRKVYYEFMPNGTNDEENLKEHIHALPHSFPWSALIRGKNRICGGALVAMPINYFYAEYVLTTAQCFLDENDKYINHDNYKVVLGAHNLARRQGQVVVGIKQVTLSAFDRSTMGPDLALITLETAVDLNDQIQLICLPIGDISMAENDRLPLVGWNTSPDSNSTQQSIVLQQIPIELHSDEQCEEVFQNYSPNKHICGSIFDPAVKAFKPTVDIGSILSAEIANQTFLYGLFSGHLSSSSAENDIFLFNRIQYSAEWLMRTADPAFYTFHDIQIVYLHS